MIRSRGTEPRNIVGAEGTSEAPGAEFVPVAPLTKTVAKGVTKTRFKLNNKGSVSLASTVVRKQQSLAPSSVARRAGFRGEDPAEIHETDQTSVLIETREPEEFAARVSDLPHTKGVQPLGGPFVSAQIGSEVIETVLADPAVRRVQTKKESRPHLNETLPEIGLLHQRARQVEEDGTGVLIGVVDSGFDLSHPFFRDAGNNLRVEALLEQRETGNLEYTQAQLDNGWSGGTGPGADSNGHGTHVASIAAGSKYLDYEGVAPGARLLLVKTDFVDTPDAVSWIFRKAGKRPCVVNMSLGHHFGAHDGTDQEERLHRVLSGPGRIIVVAAGNERDKAIHIGARFLVGEVQAVPFNVRRQPAGPTGLVLTLWYDQSDRFDVEVITPFGQALPVPPLRNTGDLYQTQSLDLELARKRYSWSRAVQVQITLSFKGRFIDDPLLEGWQLRIKCRQAGIGRIDGWMNNYGVGAFAPHPLVETARTVGISATGEACIAVASYVNSSEWQSDQGPQVNERVLRGRNSPFSSRGPTRNGRWKPDLAAPGQYLTAALADLSELARWAERSQVNDRLLTMEGTSMAAPVITGAVALLLQRDPALTPKRAQAILAESARHDGHTGIGSWTADYGYGKLDLLAALRRL
jgi:subtilisin family serine protease